MWMLVARSNFS